MSAAGSIIRTETVHGNLSVALLLTESVILLQGFGIGSNKCSKPNKTIGNHKDAGPPGHIIKMPDC